MTPSLALMVDPSVNARLYARAGIPMSSTMRSRSCSGMISADLVLDRLKDASPVASIRGRRGCADVQLDLSAVDGGKEVAADQHQPSQPRSANIRMPIAIGTVSRRLSRTSEHSSIAPAHVLEGRAQRYCGSERTSLSKRHPTDRDARP